MYYSDTNYLPPPGPDQFPPIEPDVDEELLGWADFSPKKIFRNFWMDSCTLGFVLLVGTLVGVVNVVFHLCVYHVKIKI